MTLFLKKSKRVKTHARLKKLNFKKTLYTFPPCIKEQKFRYDNKVSTKRIVEDGNFKVWMTRERIIMDQ